MMHPIEWYSTWTDAELQHLREFRRDKSRAMDGLETKDEQRDCKKYIKAATLLLDYFEGRRAGRDIPEELWLYAAVAASALIGPEQAACEKAMAKRIIKKARKNRTPVLQEVYRFMGRPDLYMA
jgi:hypothetical protein